MGTNLLSYSLTQHIESQYDKDHTLNSKKQDNKAKEKKKIQGLADIKMKNQIKFMEKMKEKLAEHFEIDDIKELKDPKFLKFLEN